MERAPERAAEIGAVVFQLFTKQPSRWAEPRLDEAAARAFAAACRDEGVAACGSHDSYLINLASPDPALWKRSLASFRAELERATVLDLDFVVTHPGNATDGDGPSGVARNAEGIGRALEAVPGRARVLLELTAGSGTSVGGTFAELAAIRDRLPTELAARVGICLDTCHAWAAGYDLVNDWDGVWRAFDDTLGLDLLGLVHLNDSVGGLGSHRDRHAGIGEGALGEGPFRRLMTDDRLRSVPKVLETPKGDDPVAADRANLARLRGYREGG